MSVLTKKVQKKEERKDYVLTLRRKPTDFPFVFNLQADEMLALTPTHLL